MKITEALKSLENSWSREDVLIKTKKGEDSEKIINDFLDQHQNEIFTLTEFITPKDKILLTEIEDLSNCEAKLIKKIKNCNPHKNLLLNTNQNHKKIFKSERKISMQLTLFMMKWSNKFVFISLLLISAIALSKQAWA